MFKGVKYKLKYLQLKKLLGGELKRKTDINPSFEKPNDLYNDTFGILDELKVIPKYDFLILKLGSTDIESNQRCENGNCMFFYETAMQLYYEHKSNPSKKTNVDTKIAARINNTFGKLSLENGILLQIDPNDKTFYPFDNHDDDTITLRNGLVKFGEKLVTKKYIKGYFPLARGISAENDANKIINELVNYDGYLILFNAIGSQCYGIMKSIIDMRRIKGKNTIYAGIVNEATDANCDINELKFEMKENNVVPIDKEKY
jgi:hypothetical protein